MRVYDPSDDSYPTRLRAKLSSTARGVFAPITDGSSTFRTRDDRVVKQEGRTLDLLEQSLAGESAA